LSAPCAEIQTETDNYAREISNLAKALQRLQHATVRVMAMVAFVMLLVFMTMPTHHYGVSPDLPKVSHPISMPGALREDVLQVTILRDGKVYFGREQVFPFSVGEKIQARLKDRDLERKVYIRADARARYGTVKIVLDGVRSAGVLTVAFLADQRRVLSPVR
jgi:biopolymer transport protein TolR